MLESQQLVQDARMRTTIDKTVGLMIDVQTRLLPAMLAPDRVIAKNITLFSGLALLQVPRLCTEQYRKGLGPTAPELLAVFDHAEPIEKSAFSCCDHPPFVDALAAFGRTTVIIGGIEAHVCVLQTAIDLIANGYQPVVAVDAISSRHEIDLSTALRRMEQEGVRLTTVEAILFELTRVSGTTTFKEVSRLIK